MARFRFIASAATLWALAHCSAADRVVVGWNSPPQVTAASSYQDAVGFSASVVREAARRAGIEITWKEVRTSQDVDRFLDTHQIDISPAAVPTSARRSRYYITEPWWSEDMSLVVRSGGPQTESAMAGKRIAVKSPVILDFAHGHFPHSTILPFEGGLFGVAVATTKVCSGQAEAALMPHRDADVTLGIERPATCAGVQLSIINSSGTVPVALMTRLEKRAVADRLRAEIAGMTEDGTLARTAARFPFPSSSAAAMVERMREAGHRRTLWGVICTLSLLVFISGGALFYSRRLHAHLRRAQERLQLEHEALRQAHSQLEAMLDSIPEPMMVTDERGTLVRTNAAFNRDILYRTTVENYIGRVEAYTEDGELICPEQWPINRVRRGERLEYLDVILSIDGIRTNRRFSGCPVLDKHGRVTHAIVSFYDITDQKRTAEKLRAANDHLRRAHAQLKLKHEIARIGTYEWFVPENRVEWSAEMEGLYGISSDTHEHTFEEWQASVHPDDLPQTLAAIDAAIRARQATLDATYRVIRPDGSTIWIHSRGKYDYDADGRPRYMLGVNMDITAIVKAEEELRRSNDDLQAYAYTISHDLQEPLRTVTSYAELLVRRHRDLLPQDAQEFLNTIRAGTLRMTGMLNDLLKYSRASQDLEPPTNVDANQTVDTIRLLLHQKIAETGASVISGPLPAIEAWPGRLEQVLQNLIENALKYSRTGVPPRVDIHAAREGELWRFDVTDNGIGMDMRYAEKIFRVFQRLHVRTEYSGNGIGLAVARRLVERHGGRIWLDWSEPGQGTRFSFTWPSRVRQQSERAPAA